MKNDNYKQMECDLNWYFIKYRLLELFYKHVLFLLDEDEVIEMR